MNLNLPLAPCHPRGHVGMRGFSLVEFMVAMAISLVVVAAASAVYLNTSQTQKVLTDRQNLFDGARVAMDMIGRDLENAGYYPADFSPELEDWVQTVNVVGYQQPCFNPRPDPGSNKYQPSFCPFSDPPAFNEAVFGCTGQKLTRTGTDAAVAYACGNLPTGVTGTDVDGLVVNYFTTDAASLSIGQRGDCEGADVARDAINSRNGIGSSAAPTRIKGNSELKLTDEINTTPKKMLETVPDQPLFVSNRYSANLVTETIDGQTITSYSLACDGNGNDNDASAAAASAAQPMVSGISQLKFQYRQQDPASVSGNSQYFSASGVTKWANVNAVRVCILARSSSPAANLPKYKLFDCNGEEWEYTDRFQRKVFTQVFALKNKLM